MLLLMIQEFHCTILPTMPVVTPRGTYGKVIRTLSFPHPGEKMTDEEWPGVLMDYAEVEFYLAEAAQRGFALVGLRMIIMSRVFRPLRLLGRAFDADSFPSRSQLSLLQQPPEQACKKLQDKNILRCSIVGWKRGPSIEGLTILVLMYLL